MLIYIHIIKLLVYVEEENYSVCLMGTRRSYYDVIMRNERALVRTRRYIDQNPERWIADRFYNKDTMAE